MRNLIYEEDLSERVWTLKAGENKHLVGRSKWKLTSPGVFKSNIYSYTSELTSLGNNQAYTSTFFSLLHCRSSWGTPLLVPWTLLFGVSLSNEENAIQPTTKKGLLDFTAILSSFNKNWWLGRN